MNDVATSRRRRVLYIARAPFISGAERALLSMLRHLDRSRVEPHLVLGHETELAAQARELDVPVTMLAVPKRSRFNLLPWWWSVARLTKLVRRLKPDVLHANDVPSCQAMSVVGAKLGVPRVVHVRWVIDAAAAAWWARRGAERLLCISKWVRDELGDTAGTAIADAKLVIMPDAVDWPVGWAESAKPTNAPNPRLDVNVERDAITPLTLGFTGQLIESKGLDLVIEAMGLLPAASRPRLLVAGEDTQTGGAYKAQLQSLASQHGVADRIEWLGFLDDVSELHRQVDAMVCPSRIEPLGLVPLEAARFSVPTIANRVGGLAETIVHDETGLLVDPTADAWAQALRQAQDHDALKRWGEAMHQRTIEFYSPAIYQQRLLAVYDEMVRVSNEV